MPTRRPRVLRSSAVFFVPFSLVSFAAIGPALAATDWSRSAEVPPGGRANILGLPDAAWAESVQAGKLHALEYPVEVTGALFPYQPLLNILDAESREPNPLRWILRKLGGGLIGMRSFADIEALVGVISFPALSDRGLYQVPRPDFTRPDAGMGTTILEHDGATGLTFSCAACHAAKLFGKSVLGMTNRFPKANDFFLLGQAMTQSVGGGVFGAITRATEAEKRTYGRLRTSIRSIGAKKPLVEGLDTSLAQVGLSLSKRAPDEDATRDDAYIRQPAPNVLDDAPADSKPAVWWRAPAKRSPNSLGPLRARALWSAPWDPTASKPG